MKKIITFLVVIMMMGAMNINTYATTDFDKEQARAETRVTFNELVYSKSIILALNSDKTVTLQYFDWSTGKVTKYAENIGYYSYADKEMRNILLDTKITESVLKYFSTPTPYEKMMDEMFPDYPKVKSDFRYYIRVGSDNTYAIIVQVPIREQ